MHINTDTKQEKKFQFIKTEWSELFLKFRAKQDMNQIEAIEAGLN